ncbi:PREDICTED: putative F-box/kelch-repeat protein At4g35120 [Brassica oleracea var. oleracea]|nr:PREDICTED: putative F-box/kelch-repeat protein At4g35120 [Brassica oleracea var. oleracea]
MTNNPIAPPPPAKKRKTSLSSIPDDVIVNVLARISISQYRSLCLVSKNFYSLLSSPDIYFARSLIGITDARLYVCLRLPTPSSSHRHRWFNLGYRQGQLSLVPVRTLSSSPDRLNSTSVAVHSEIYQIGGGSNEDKRTRAVRVLDCRSRTWRPAPDMKVARKHARSYFLDDKIYVIGGCKENWGEVFDLKTQNWKPLPKPPSDHDHKGVVYGGRLYAFTMNKNKNYAYDPKEERWVQEAGFVGLGRITGPLCVIGNEIFAEHDRKYTWYNPTNGKQQVIDGLNDVYKKRANNYRTIQLVNHGGKLVILWNETRRKRKRLWCAVVSLEERSTPLGTRMRGKVERCDLLLDSAHKSYMLSSCLSVLL